MRRATHRQMPEAKTARSTGPYKPKHRKIFDILLSEISSGQFRAGDRIPTETELAKKYSASRTTIARAMRDLKRRGLLDRQRGGGTRIIRQDTLSRVALFTPAARNILDLPFIDTRLHAYLAELASQRGDDLRLQFTGRQSSSVMESMLAAADEIIDKGIKGVFYRPLEESKENLQGNHRVVDKLRAAGLAVLLVEHELAAFPKRSGMPLVRFDNRRAGYLLAEHMIDRGCRRLMFIGLPEASREEGERFRGYADALLANGLQVDRSMYRQVHADDLNLAYCQSLIEEFRPDGMICQVDPYAALLARHLEQTGNRIGQDILLGCFEDQPIAEALPVPLTTVRFPIESFAQVCYERLRSQINGGLAAQMGVTMVDVKLVIRASTDRGKKEDRK